MQEPRVTTFFYGSYMNFDVLTEAGLAPDHFEVARLPGFDIRIGPLANLVRSDERSVYGLLAATTHAELDRLYAHARQVLGGIYLPHPVVAHALDGKLVPALCYIAPSMAVRPASPEYIARTVAPARKHGFPEWYIERLESFRPS